jgi:hypothetical protein
MVTLATTVNTRLTVTYYYGESSLMLLVRAGPPTGDLIILALQSFTASEISAFSQRMGKKRVKENQWLLKVLGAEATQITSTSCLGSGTWEHSP